jgi:hypothetical protein
LFTKFYKLSFDEVIMRKIMFLVLIIICAIFFVSCSSNNDSNIDKSTTFKENVTEKENKEVVSKDLSGEDLEKKEILVELCGAEKPELNGYDGGSVFRCGNYYKINPPSNLADAPLVVYDMEGNIMGYCAGMPSSNGDREAPVFCDMSCREDNLCS